MDVILKNGILLILINKNIIIIINKGSDIISNFENLNLYIGLVLCIAIPGIIRMLLAWLFRRRKSIDSITTEEHKISSIPLDCTVFEKTCTENMKSNGDAYVIKVSYKDEYNNECGLKICSDSPALYNELFVGSKIVIHKDRYKRNGRRVTVYDFAEVPYVDKTYKFYKINPKL